MGPRMDAGGQTQERGDRDEGQAGHDGVGHCARLMGGIRHATLSQIPFQRFSPKHVGRTILIDVFA